MNFSSPYGADDQIGMLNEITPQKVVQAARLIKKGKSYDLSHTLDSAVPAFPGRSFHQVVVTAAHEENRRRPDAGSEGWGENNINWIIDVVYGTSQMGTHLDALNHLQIGDRFYNGYRMGELIEAYGTNKLGVESVPQIITRGVLLDITRVRGVARLERGDVIGLADIHAALETEQISVTRGDAVFFHTGWGALWMNDNATYLSGEPGPGVEAAHWLVKQGVVLTGCDTWSYGAVPGEHTHQPFVVPQMLNVQHGMFIVENLFTSELAHDGVYEFMLTLTHAKVRGATGAWVAPVAIC